MRGSLMIVLAALPVTIQVVVIAAVVIVLLVGGGIFLLLRSRKNAGGKAVSGVSDWQRQQGAAGAWNQQAAAGAWGQQQQPGGWGMQNQQQPQPGGWGAQNQQQPGAWGAGAQNSMPGQQNTGPWGGQSGQSPAQQPAWGAQNAAQQPAQPANPWGTAGQAQNPWGQPAQGAAQQGAGAWGSPPQPAAQSSPWDSAPAAAQAPSWGNPQAQQGQPSFGSSNPSWGQPAPAAQDPWAAPAAASSPPSWQQGGFGQNISTPGMKPDSGALFGSMDADKTVLRSAGAPVQPPGAGLGIIRVEEGKEPGRIYEIRKESLSIGRSRESDIFLEDLAVSRLHASILNMGNGSYALKDEGSANGTRSMGNWSISIRPIRCKMVIVSSSVKPCSFSPGAKMGLVGRIHPSAPTSR